MADDPKRGPSVAEAVGGEPDYGYGFRYNSRDPKGLGFLGNFLLPDGSGVMGEYSVSVPINGRQMEIPSIVPTLTREEVLSLLMHQEGQPLPAPIIQKAITHAQARIAAGLPVFARTGEQQNLYPELPRAAIPPARPQAPPLVPSHAPSSAPIALSVGEALAGAR